MAEEEGPEPKRRKCYSKSELLKKLKENGDDVSKAVEEVVTDLSPFDMTDENVSDLEEKVEKLEKVSKSLTNKVYILKKEVKARKYKKKPELLEENIISCSQYSVLQSEEDPDDLCSNFSQQCLGAAAASSQEAADGESPVSYRKQPLNSQMDPRSRRRRVSDKRELFSQWAEQEGVSVTVLLGLILHLENWNGGEKSVAAIGWKIFMGEKVPGKPSVTLEEAIWLMERSGMSQAVCLETRLRFLDRIYFPPVMNIRAENQRHRPSLQEYKHGVKSPLKECLSLTLTERLDHMDLSEMDTDTMQVKFKVGWGLDGSGEHSNYHQLTKVSYNTKQVMSVCFAVREVVVSDASGARVCWSSTEAGANKPQNTRPLALFPAKESNELLSEFVPIVEAEVKEIEAEGVKVNVKGVETEASCEKCSMSMLDGKMVTNLLNCGGCYCTMCIKSREECHEPETIQLGFLMDRDLVSIRDLALSLTDPDTGEVVRRRGDYSTRQGVCGEPRTESDLTKSIPVCHSKIRVFEWTTELVVRNKSHKKWCTPTNKVRYTDEEKEDYKSKRETVKEEVYTNLAINIGNPGDMVTGKAFVKFSSDSSRAFYVSLVEEDQREDFNLILLGLSAAVKIINSQKRRVNTEKLRELTLEVYLKIVQCFPWAVISPSVHRILAHGWEVIQLNQGFGLGDLSEEGLEALNKLIREMRCHGSRKDSTVNNFTDTFNHLWDRSRPTIVEMEREIKRKKPKVLISTEIEALVDSLFLEEAQDE